MKTVLRGVLLLALPLLLLAFAGVLGGRSHPVVAQTPRATPPGGPPPSEVRYRAGWNIVAVTKKGDNPYADALYTLTADETDYQAVTAAGTRPGVGYWAYFARDTPVNLVPRSPCERAVANPDDPSSGHCETAFPPIVLPAGKWVMIGNPYTAPISVVGADLVEVYDPISESYEETMSLPPGQGAFVYSDAGGFARFSR